MKKSANTAQLICTTFRQELPDVADKIYEVSYANKVSKVRPCTKDRAKKVIAECVEQEMREKEEQQGINKIGM